MGVIISSRPVLALVRSADRHDQPMSSGVTNRRCRLCGWLFL